MAQESAAAGEVEPAETACHDATIAAILHQGERRRTVICAAKRVAWPMKSIRARGD